MVMMDGSRCRWSETRVDETGMGVAARRCREYWQPKHTCYGGRKERLLRGRRSVRHGPENEVYKWALEEDG
jgi:hypothetical protein